MLRAVILLFITASQPLFDTTGWKPSHHLLMAALSGVVATAALLLASGVDAKQKNARGDSPLFDAILSDNPTLVRSLLAAGADVNERRPDGMTPLMVAALAHRTAIVRLLLQLGADPLLTDKFGYTALRHASDLAYTDPRTTDRTILFRMLPTP